MANGVTYVIFYIINICLLKTFHIFDQQIATFMGELKFKHLKGKNLSEELHINKTKESIRACLRVIKYVDKDTNHHVSYIPSLEISGYGNTRKEATEMLHFSLDEYFDFLISYPETKTQKELRELGWLKNKIKNKDYSKAYVDISGNLKNFALMETVEEEMLAF